MADCGLTLPNYEDLSKEQDAVLNLPLEGRHVIIGPPGSGKTVMAILRASQLYERHDEEAILLMYNKLLSTYTGAATEKRGVEAVVRTFHSWFPSMYSRTYKSRPPQVAPYVYDWVAILDAMGDGLLPSVERSHLIVDEGQDMSKYFYMMLPHICESISVFADENQQLNPTNNSSIAQIKALLQVPDASKLTANYRNSRPIAEVAANFHVGIQTGIADVAEAVRGGDPVELVHDDDISGLIRRLVKWERSHQQECIGVFVPYTSIQTQIYNRLGAKTRNPVQMYSANKKKMEGKRPISFGSPSIKIIAYPSTKGLEFDTVFIPMLETYKKGNAAPDAPDVSSLFYVMSSRARRTLIFEYTGANEPAFIKRLPLDKIKDMR